MTTRTPNPPIAAQVSPSAGDLPLDRRLVIIPAAEWKTFEAWVQAPAKLVPALRDLAMTRPAWQDWEIVSKLAPAH